MTNENQPLLDRLRKLALRLCELELLRKPSPLGDERGSVREIGLCVRNGATLLFSRLSPTARWFLSHCHKWSFSRSFPGA